MKKYCIEESLKCKENGGASKEFAKAMIVDSKRGGSQSSAKGA